MNLREALVFGRDALIESDTAEIDAEMLLCHVLNSKRVVIHICPEKQLDDSQQRQFEELIHFRKLGHPVAYLTGKRGFWTLDLSVNADTLIPRPDTELLVEEALKLIQPGMSVADLGTGTGAIALAIASENEKFRVTATDYSAEALLVAKRNASEHQLQRVNFVQADWLTPFRAHSFDVIVSNPPYIEKTDPHLKQGDLRFEPITALASGSDGLDDIREIIEQATSTLKPGGWLLLEHGYEQASAVMDLMSAAGFQQLESRQDYGANDRVVIGQLAL